MYYKIQVFYPFGKIYLFSLKNPECYQYCLAYYSCHFRDMGLHLFRVYIVLNNLVQTRTVEGLLMLIEKERQGDTVDRTLLKSLLRMLSDLQIYQDAFETKYEYLLYILVIVIVMFSIIIIKL